MSHKRAQDSEIDYELRLTETEAGTGYFSCVPREEIDFESGLAYLKHHPFDEFMRKHLLERMGQWREDQFRERVRSTDSEDVVVRPLLLEACMLHDSFKEPPGAFPTSDCKRFARSTPFPYIASRLLKDQPLHARWIELFRRNIQDHQPLPPPGETGLLQPVSNLELSAMDAETVSIEAIHPEFVHRSKAEEPDPPTPGETAEIALDKLAGIGVIAGEVMRHTASLSPIALLREWKVDIRVRSGRHRYRLSGKQTSYGRGLELDHAQAACAMEMVERCSAFANFGPDGVIGYQAPHSLVRGRYTEMLEKGFPVLDPDDLALQTPYNDEPLHWIEGATPGENGLEPIRVPAQCIFLFCNLDEIALFQGIGSTGLASGNTMAQAKVNGLLEIIERDCEGVTPFVPDRCFDLETTEPRLATLLLNYLENGIRMQFQDLTSPLGIPCCKCFVTDASGAIVKGTGAHLDARRALLSAMTETPYPFPGGPPSGAGLPGLLRVPFEKLPDFRTGSFDTDLMLLEHLLTANGRRPIYVDLTRRDLGLPVVRAIIPGMEITGDFDRYSRVHPRLFANYRNLFR